MGPYRGLDRLPLGLLLDLKRRHGVSLPTLLAGSAPVGVLPKEDTFAQRRGLNRVFRLTSEPEPLGREMVLSHLERLVLLAYLRGEVFPSMAAEVLGVDLRDAEAWLSKRSQEVTSLAAGQA